MVWFDPRRRICAQFDIQSSSPRLLTVPVTFDEF